MKVCSRYWYYDSFTKNSFIYFFAGIGEYRECNAEIQWFTIPSTHQLLTHTIAYTSTVHHPFTYFRSTLPSDVRPSVRPSVRLSVRYQLFSETNHRISLIFCIKLAFDKWKKVTKPDFQKKIYLAQILANWAQICPNSWFLVYYSNQNH